MLAVDGRIHSYKQLHACSSGTNFLRILFCSFTEGIIVAAQVLERPYIWEKFRISV